MIVNDPIEALNAAQRLARSKGIPHVITRHGSGYAVMTMRAALLQKKVILAEASPDSFQAWRLTA